MAARPRSGSDDNDSDFDWMYGSRHPGRSEDAPEPTKVLPEVPQRRRPTPAQPSSPPPPRTKRRRRITRFGFWVKLVLALVVLWLIYLVAVPVFAWQEVDKIAFEPEGDRPGEQPGTTYLMVGSDSRADLTEEQRRELATGNPQSTLADTIMLLHVGDGPDTLVSIPRDWTVDGRKINGRYDAGDPSEMVATIEQQTGVRVDEYVEIGLGGVAGVVDAVGGVEICPDQDIKDPKAGLDVQTGCQHADGATALAYARTRATKLSDLDRVQRQREVVTAVGKKVLSPWTVIDPLRWWQLNNAVPDFFAFGEGTSQIDVARWARAMTSLGEGRTCTMPVTDLSATTMDPERAEPLFAAIIEDRTDDITDDLCTPAGVPQ